MRPTARPAQPHIRTRHPRAYRPDQPQSRTRHRQAYRPGRPHSRTRRPRRHRSARPHCRTRHPRAYQPDRPQSRTRHPQAHRPAPPRRRRKRPAPPPASPWTYRCWTPPCGIPAVWDPVESAGGSAERRPAPSVRGAVPPRAPAVAEARCAARRRRPAASRAPPPKAAASRRAARRPTVSRGCPRRADPVAEQLRPFPPPRRTGRRGSRPRPPPCPRWSRRTTAATSRPHDRSASPPAGSCP